MEKIRLSQGQTIGDYTIKNRLGEGGCGIVYNVLNKRGEQFAMKLEERGKRKSDQLLSLEAHVLKQMQFSHFVVQYVMFAHTSDFNLLVMGLVGSSLSDLQDEQVDYKFSIGTVLLIGLQALQAIGHLHSIHIVHRDVKPSNFAIDQVNCRRIYLLDFGLVRPMKKKGDDKIRKARANAAFRGTPAYCSLNAHRRKEHGRHDDIWAMIYMLVDFKTGQLPWFRHSRASAAVLKEQLFDFEYMEGCPTAFLTILNYLRRLTYYDRPDYIGLEQTFIGMMQVRGVRMNQAVDWEYNVYTGHHRRSVKKAQMDPVESQALSQTGGTTSLQDQTFEQ